MAKAYWIVRVDIDDMETYKSCIAANAEPVSTADLVIIEGYDGPQP